MPRALFLALLLVAPPALAQAVRGPLQGEPNSAGLPVDAAAEEWLERGDAALRAGRASDAYEAWHAALIERGAASVVGAGEDGAFEALAIALRRRLAALAPAERAGWIERFEPLAARRGDDWHALAGALDSEPLCPSALRAGLRAADMAQARGERAAASALCIDVRDQARLVAGLIANGAELQAAAERRLRTLAPAAPAPAPPGGSPRAALSLVGMATIAPPGALDNWDPFEHEAGLARGLMAGLTSDGERVVLQTPLATWWAGPDLSDLRGFAPRELLRRVLPELAPDAGALAAPGWQTQPLLAGRRLWMVLGRSLEGFAPNALAAVELPPSGASAALAPLLPRLLWMRSGAQHWNAELNEWPSDAWPAELAASEFQGPPVLYGELLLVRARTLEPTARQWLLALDPDTGGLRWSALSAEGAFLIHEDARLRLIDTARASRTAAAGPLHVEPGWVFDGTHLGLGSALRLSDGLLLGARRHARRAASSSAREERGGATGALLPVGDGELCWLPADGERPGWWRRHPGGSGALELREFGAPLFGPADERQHLAGARDGLPVPPSFDAGPRVALLAAHGERTWTLREQSGAWRLAAGPGFERAPPHARVGAALPWRGGALVADEEALWVFELAPELRVVQRLDPAELVQAAAPRAGVAFRARPLTLHARGPWVWLATPTHWLVFRASDGAAQPK
jgi:hypothetical protein